MIVQVVCIKDIAVLDAERYPPITRHKYCIIASEAAGQLMQLITWSVHILWRTAPVQVRKHPLQLTDMAGLHVRPPDLRVGP